MAVSTHNKKNDNSEGMAVSTHNKKNDNSEGGLALRDFFKELFLERAAMSGSSTENDYDSCDTSDIETDVSVSSDESSTAGDGGDLNASTYHTRRRRFRRSRGTKVQRPKFTVAQDNARAVLSRKKLGSELTVSSYHNNLSTTSSLTNSVSVSLHTMKSLGSRTGISSTSVNNWRNSHHKKRGTPPARNLSQNNHRDSRWSTSGDQIPNDSRSRVKSYDFGFVNDSLHNSTTLRRKQKMSTRRNKRTNSKNVQKNSPSQSLTIRAINSAFRTVLSISSESSDCESDGEEFYEDDDDSLSTFTTSLANSMGGISHTGSSLSFCYNKLKETSLLSSMSRKGVDRTRSSGDLPRIPRRTCDDFFHEKESFEPLKGSNRGGGAPTTRKVRRSLSSDSISVSSMMTGDNKYDNAMRQSSEPVGRWAAIHTCVDSSLRCPSPPRRIPSTSQRSTGRNSNHSNDSSDHSESDSECFGFENSFSHFHDEDASLTPTVATTDSSNKDSSSISMSSYEQNALKILLPHSSMHTRLLPMSVPDSLLKLPHNSFHGTTAYTKSAKGTRHQGKSLRS